MIIKAMRLQAWAPAGEGGWARVSRHPPPSKKRSSLAILGAFLLLFLYMGPFCYVFLIFGGLFTMWEPFCYLLLYGGGLLGGMPPPLTKISAGSYDCKEGSRACSPEFFCVTTI